MGWEEALGTVKQQSCIASHQSHVKQPMSAAGRMRCGHSGAGLLQEYLGEGGTGDSVDLAGKEEETCLWVPFQGLARSISSRRLKPHTAWPVTC